MSSTIPEPGAGTRYDREPAGVSGWIVFAGVIMLIEGFLDAMWGLAAVINNEVITVGGHGVVVWDITAWGWGHLILGALVALHRPRPAGGADVGAGVGDHLRVAQPARAVRHLHALPAVVDLIIAIDIVILYQLTARWEPEGAAR